MRVLLIILAATLFSCKSTKVVTPVEKVEKPAAFKTINLPFAELGFGTNGDFPAKASTIITNQNDYNTSWKSAFSRFQTKEKPANIDFETKMVLLVTMGERTSGGYAINIKSVEEKRESIVVTIIETNPGQMCMNTSVMTYPHQFVQLEKSSKKIVFNTVQKTNHCK